MQFVLRARRFPLPNGPGQVKLPVRQVDLNRFFLFISYKQIKEYQNSWSQASDDFEKRQALVLIVAHMSWTTLVQVLFCCLVAQNDYLIKNVDIFREVL